jgi:hypothetical protein
MKCSYTPTAGILKVHPETKDFEDDCPLCLSFEVVWLDSKIIFIKNDEFHDFNRPLMIAVFAELWKQGCLEIILYTDNLTKVPFVELMSLRDTSAIWKADLKKLKKRNIF